MDAIIAALRPVAQGARPGNLRLGVTGHQELGGVETEAFLAQTFGSFLGELRQRRLVPIILSGLAAGADTLFAELALARGCVLEVCLASDDIEANFAPGLPRERFYALCRQSRIIHRLPFVERSNTAYMALGRWLGDNCDLLVAAWNGRPAVAEGGTGDVVDYALGQCKPVLHLHTRSHQLIIMVPPQPGSPAKRQG